jgi:hypothetical protein
MVVDYSYDRKATLSTSSAPAAAEIEEGKKIRIRSAAEVFKELELSKRPEQLIAKIDCEGAEYGIIESLDDSETLRDFGVLMIEWHRQGPEKLASILHKNGFASFVINSSRDIGLIYAIRR